MAVITASAALYTDQGAQRGVLMRLTKVSSGDTVDVSSIGPFAFSKVEAAFFVGRSQRVGVGATINGTVLTLTSAGMLNDTVDLYVLGE